MTLDSISLGYWTFLLKPGHGLISPRFGNWFRKQQRSIKGIRWNTRRNSRPPISPGSKCYMSQLELIMPWILWMPFWLNEGIADFIPTESETSEISNGPPWLMFMKSLKAYRALKLRHHACLMSWLQLRRRYRTWRQDKSNWLRNWRKRPTNNFPTCGLGCNAVQRESFRWVWTRVGNLHWMFTAWICLTAKQHDVHFWPIKCDALPP